MFKFLLLIPFDQIEARMESVKRKELGTKGYVIKVNKLVLSIA